jgi:2-polyprenyl-3-methyl-5-hydroxy-6-metoxy-1,4-benzoquinol methylase
MLELAGDVTGRRILDAGCGAGPLFAALRDRGAIVTGIDGAAHKPGSSTRQPEPQGSQSGEPTAAARISSRC